MDAVAALLIIDKLVSATTALVNAYGASKAVSDTIAVRIAENREWTDAERAEVTAMMAEAKAYAAAELAKPD